MTEYFQNSFNCENIPMYNCNLERTNGSCIWLPSKQKCYNYDPDQCFSKDIQQCQDTRYCRINEKWNTCENIPEKYLSAFTNYGIKYPKESENFNTFVNLLVIGITFYILVKQKLSLNVKTLLFMVIHGVLDYTLF
jgi:hypothetical protein